MSWSVSFYSLYLIYFLYCIYVRNNTFDFKEAMIQPDKLNFVEPMRKDIGANEIDKHWELVRRR